MAYHYEISIGATYYTLTNFIDNRAKVTWTKGDSGLVYKKKIDGSFTLMRSNNETVYDAIMDMTHCEYAYLWIMNGVTPIVQSIFTKRDIDFNVNKCQMVIKPRYYDPNNIEGLINEKVNVINPNCPVYSIGYSWSNSFEYIEYLKNGDYGALSFPDNIPNKKAFDGAFVTENYQGHWTYFAATIRPLSIWTRWFREIALTPKAVDPDQTPPPQGGSSYAFEFLEEVTINGIVYNKYVRAVDSLVGTYATTIEFGQYVHRCSLTSYYGFPTSRTLTRARKLNDLIDVFRTLFGCSSWSSHFFKDASNPISGIDLSNIFIMQKSDAIFVDGAEKSDAATIGYITFKELMEQLWAMFQVTWVIQNNVLYVEHINFFKNNLSYITNNNVGIDLTTYYPKALEHSNAYSYESNLPVREQFTFMEAWNIDFIGADIHFVTCLREGDTVGYNASLITTDIDPSDLDTAASNDGFVLFHADKFAWNFNGNIVYTYEVHNEEGRLSGIETPNAHLSFANLHYYYWRYNQAPFNFSMNGIDGVAPLAPYRKIKKQTPLEFPYCLEDIDNIVNDLVRTDMGDGEIASIEYDMKKHYVKVELLYNI